MYQVLVPNLGQSGLPVRIENWFKHEGDHVEKGEELFELSNEKLSQEVEASVTGTLVKVYVQEGEQAAPKSLLAEIELD